MYPMKYTSVIGLKNLISWKFRLGSCESAKSFQANHSAQTYISRRTGTSNLAKRHCTAARMTFSG